MSQFKVALLQMSACGNDQSASQAKGEAFCLMAATMGADLALFPEMWNVGYTPVREASLSAEIWREAGQWTEERAKEVESLQLSEVWQGQAITRDSPFIKHFQALAHELDMAIAITYLEQWPGYPRNSVSIIDRHGQIALTYAKLHTCDWVVNEAAVTPGDDFSVCELDTRDGVVKVGTMICFDREMPESARILMLKGAEIILTPNGCNLEQHRLGQFRARAYENMIGAAMANYAGPRMGHSVAYDPIAFDKHGSRDTLVIEAGESEGVYLANFDMDAIREYRRREVWGNAFRKPHRYAALTATGVEEPFVRVNWKGERFIPTDR